jgi:hypothetical protein
MALSHAPASNRLRFCWPYALAIGVGYSTARRPRAQAHAGAAVVADAGSTAVITDTNITALISGSAFGLTALIIVLA